MTKKKSLEFFGVKMEFFSEKVRENFLASPQTRRQVSAHAVCQPQFSIKSIVTYQASLLAIQGARNSAGNTQTGANYSTGFHAILDAVGLYPSTGRPYQSTERSLDLIFYDSFAEDDAFI